MFRIPIKSSPRFVLTQFRLASAASAEASSAQRHEVDLLKLTREQREEIYKCRDQIRQIMREKCIALSEVNTLSKKEAASEYKSIERFATAMYDNLHVKHPFSDLIGYCMYNELAIVDQLYKSFVRTEEFKGLINDEKNPRPHLFTPGATLLVNQLESKELNEPAVRLKHIVGFLNSYLERYTQLRPIAVLLNFLAFNERPEFLLKILGSSNKHRLVATNWFGSLLHFDKMDRLKELMECKLKTDTDIRIFANRITSVVIRKLKTIKLDVPSSAQELQTIAQVLAIGFQSGDVDSTGGQALVTIFGSNAVSDDVLKRIVDCLMDDSNVLVSRIEISRIETQLRDANQHTRAKLIARLKQKNSTHARWINTHDLSVLVSEAESMEQKDGIKPEVFASLYNVILSKSSNPLILSTLSWLLPKFHDLMEHKMGSTENKYYRSSFNSTLRTAIDQALLHRQYDAFDQLWELRKLTEKASKILKTLSESAVSLDEKVLNQVVSSDFMRSVTSEQLVENFVKMLAEHFTVSTEWHQRLMGSVQLNDLRTSISEGHLDEVNTKINQMGDTIVRDVATSFILIDLLKAAIKANNAPVFAKAKGFIEARRDRHTTVLYIGLSFLELNDQRWPTMLKKINHIPTEIMTQLIKRQSAAKRADVLHILFNTMNKSGMANLDLEILLRETVSVYFNLHDLDGLRKLYDEVKGSGFYMRTELKTSIESNIKKLEKQLAATGADPITPQPPKSSSPSENQPLKQ